MEIGKKLKIDTYRLHCIVTTLFANIFQILLVIVFIVTSIHLRWIKSKPSAHGNCTLNRRQIQSEWWAKYRQGKYDYFFPLKDILFLLSASSSQQTVWKLKKKSSYHIYMINKFSIKTNFDLTRKIFLGNLWKKMKIIWSKK